MLRFRNPGSNAETQIAVFQALYKELKNAPSFTYSDMEQVIGQTSLMTSYGHSGQRALAITGKRSDSLNPTKMNMKMYAEVFRLLGWISPSHRSSSYPVDFTLLGACAAQSTAGARALMKESLLGYVNPSEHNLGVTYTEQVRFFPLALRSIKQLDGRMYKHELCLGPMSCDETDDENYGKMINSIAALRGDYQRLTSAFKKLADSLGMQTTSVDNMTRFPIGALRDVGWINTQVADKTLYNKSLKCIEITDEGKLVIESVENMFDLRLASFRSMPAALQPPLIRVGVYSMLQRAGYNIESVESQLDDDKSKLSQILNGRELLFSPYQTLRAHEVNEALGITTSTRKAPDTEVVADLSSELVSAPSTIGESELVTRLTPKSLVHADSTTGERDSCTNLRLSIEKLHLSGLSKESIIEQLFLEHRADKQVTFYPLVADLFTIIGMPCTESRAGDNGARWDAMISDSKHSIPIEIKSPTEENFLSLKAIRQALENKIILLSRKQHPTEPKTTSLAVGYEQPNARAEVKQLINDIDEAYDIQIGVVTLRPLLQLAVESVINKVVPNRYLVQQLKGILDVGI